MLYGFGGIVSVVFLRHSELFIELAGFFALFAATFYWFRWYARESAKDKLLRSGIKDIDHMNGFEFEQYLGAMFERAGYKIEYTPVSGDYGADLLLRRGRQYVAVQAKCYRNTVGVVSVQQVIGAKGHYQTNEAWVITNNKFTKNACNLAKSNNVKLFDRGDLLNLMLDNRSVKQSKKPRPV